MAHKTGISGPGYASAPMKNNSTDNKTGSTKTTGSTSAPEAVKHGGTNRKKAKSKSKY